MTWGKYIIFTICRHVYSYLYISLSMERMQLNPETGSHRPADDDGDEYESDSEDEDSIDQAIYDSLYEDDEGFDEEYDDRR